MINLVKELKNIPSFDIQIRKFGYLFSIIFILIGIYINFKTNNINYNFFLISVTIFLIARFLTFILTPFYFLWMSFGIIIGSIVSNIVLSLIFAILFVPIGFFLKIAGKDFLGIKENLNDTYWNYSNLSSNSKESLDKQY